MAKHSVPKQLQRAAAAALDKKAAEVVLLDLDGVASFTGYFLLCTGQSNRQVKAIADAVEERLGRAGLVPAHVEGYEQAEWVLLDYLDFVVHIFSPRAATSTTLERLWRRATRFPLPEQQET